MKCLKLIVFIFYLLLVYSSLIANPDYDLFSSDSVKTFSSIGIEKAKGINLTFKYPGTWKYYKGERPNVLCRLYESLGDNKFVTVVVLIKDIPDVDKTDTDKKLAAQILNTNNIAYLIPPGSTFIKGNVTKYDDQPGMCLEFIQTQSMASIEGTMFFLNHMFIYKQKSVYVQCSIGGLSNDNTVKTTFDEFKPLFINIGMSIVLPDKWNDNDVKIHNNNSTNYKAVGHLALLILVIVIIIIAVIKFHNNKKGMIVKLVDHTDEVVQDEISPEDKILLRKFNWGAFLLSPIWSLVYQQWGWFGLYVIVLYFVRYRGSLSLSLIFATLYLIFSAIMGKEANKLAWKTKSAKFKSIEATVQAQSKWIIPGIIISALQIVFGLILGVSQIYQW